MSRRKAYCREVYRLRQEGLSFEDIANRLERPVTTVMILYQLGEQGVKVAQSRKEHDALLKKYYPQSPEPLKYTLDDLKRAEERLAGSQAYRDSYVSNNPNKYRNNDKYLRLEVVIIKEHLTADGALPPVPPRPLTEKELLDKELDEAFPNAQSKQIVEHKGRKYRRRFWPLDKSRSGKTVHEWGCDWIEIDKG
jgi:hypothetical protein